MKKGLVFLPIVCIALLCGCQSANQQASTDTTAAPTTQAATVATQAVTTTAPATTTAGTQSGVESETEADTQSSVAKNDDGNITEAAAKSIVLKDAGLTESQISDFTCETDELDEVTVYGIEFTANGVVYYYDLDASTGDILATATDTADEE